MAERLQYWETQREAMHQRMRHWLPSPAFADSYYADAHPPVSVWQEVTAMRSGPERDRLLSQMGQFGVQSPEFWAAYQNLATAGQVWFGQAVMANPALRSQPDASLPCLVLVPLDQSPQGILSAGIMAGILYAIYSGKEKAADYPRTAAILQDDEFQYFRRVELPSEELRGFEGIVINVLLRQRWLPPEAEALFIPLLGDPGPSQAVVQIPWALAAGRPLPLGDTKPGRYADAAPGPGPRRTPGRPPRPPVKKKKKGGILALFGWVLLVLIAISFASVLIEVLFLKR